MSKVAIYCRLSDEDRGKESEDQVSESIQNQKNILTAYAIEKGWSIYKIYCDEDYSGMDAERPEYNQLLEDAENGKFHIILCKTQSRFTRDMEQVEKYIHNKFLEWNIRFVSIIDNVDTDIRGNKKSRQINGLINEWYLEDLSENVKAVLLSKKKKGKFVGAFAPYGYLKDPLDKNHLIIDSVASQIVKRIFEMYLDGLGLRKIAGILNAESIPSPVIYKQQILGLAYKIESGRRGSKGKWTDSSISMILRNQMYIGDMVQNKSARISYKNHEIRRLSKEKWIIVEGTHEPIIDRETFQKVSELAIKKNKPTASGNISLYAGKLRCGSCDSSMVKQTARGKAYYRCGYTQRNPSDCKGNFVAEQLISEQILVELKKLIEEYTTEARIAAMIDIEESKQNSLKEIRIQKSSLKKELQKIEKLREDLYIDKSDGTISKEHFMKMDNSFSQKQLIVEKELNKLELKISKLDYEAEMYQSELENEKMKIEVIKNYLNLNELTRDIVVELIDYIIVLDTEKRGCKKIEIHWNL